MLRFVILAALLVGEVQAADVVAWKGAEMSAWTNHLLRCANPRMTAEGVAVEAVGCDPQLYAQPSAPFVGEYNHYVEIVLRSSVAGRHQLFWSSEKKGRCTWDRRADFDVKRAGEWETHVVRPVWIGEGRITSLRIDPPDSLRGLFELRSVRVFAEEEARGVDTRKFSGIVFDAATLGQEYASITWISDVAGRKLLGFTTSPDGARHSYWFDFTNSHNLKYKHTGEKAWSGTVCALTVEQVLSGKKLLVENMRLVSGRPNLPPDIGVTYAGPESAIPRAGRPLALELILRNYGTEPARNVRFAFDGLPKNCRVLDKADLEPSGEIGACDGWDSVGDDFASGRLPNERRFRVTLSDPGAGRHVFGLTVSADGMAPRCVSVTAEILPSLGLPKADRMPAPKPVKTGKYEIGAFIFPGWDTHLWHGVWTRAPHRKPVLGWYDETNPDVIDWQIKHLVENGVSFVFVDWYWSRGSHYHKHWPVAFGKARYRGLLKWSLMWANHNAPGAHSVADQEKVTRYWIDNYFRDPQYMQIDGKPVVSIWSANAMERDMGPGGCRKLLDVSRRLAAEAGLGGVYFIAVRSPSGRTDREFLAKYKAYGFDGTCVYKYMDDGNPKVPPRVDGFQDYRYLADSSLSHWRELQANADLPFLPSLTTAYDDRPWRGEMSSPVKNINAADFRRICADARRFADETGVTRLLLGPLDEWGEGSIGYPNRELGFGMLEAVRDTFGEKPAEGWPLNYAPEDIATATAVATSQGQTLVEMSGCETGKLVALPDNAFSEFRQMTNRRIAEIRATPNMEIPAGAECRYLSEKGDDSADGRTPATAWRTPARLDRGKMPQGSFVLFERGGVFRGGFRASAGVTYTAYGKGAKPRIYSSPENSADPAKWERTDAANVWRYKIGTDDVGTIVFDDGRAHAIKILPIYNGDGSFTQQYGGRPFNNGYKDLAEDLHFWHDYSDKTDFKPFAKGSGYLYLRSEKNPGERFKSIEFNVKKHGVTVGDANNVHVDNLCIKYVGSHGIGAGTVKGLRVTNCEFGWIGGSIQAERIFGRNWATRYGNAVEIYGGCDGFTVNNCYVYQVYDAGLTQQFNVGNTATFHRQVRYANNVIENCNYSIEYFLSGVQQGNPSRTEGFVIEDNLMWNAGVGFCRQRPDGRQAAHIKSWRNNCNRATRYIVRRNLLACGADTLVEISSGLVNPDGSDSMPVMECNVFIGAKCQRFGVVNQGKPAERAYDENIVSALGERFSGNVFSVH